jgi:hypothetical protein
VIENVAPSPFVSCWHLASVSGYRSDFRCRGERHAADIAEMSKMTPFETSRNKARRASGPTRECRSGLVSRASARSRKRPARGPTQRDFGKFACDHMAFAKPVTSSHELDILANGAVLVRVFRVMDQPWRGH